MADESDIKTPEQIQASMKAMDEYMDKIKELAEVEGLLGDSLVGRLESQTIQLHEILDQRHEVRKKNIQAEIAESKKSADYFREMMEKGTNSNLSQEHLSLLVESNEKAANLYDNIRNLNSEQASMMAKQVDQNYQSITGAQGGTLADPQTPAGAFASGNVADMSFADMPEQQLSQAFMGPAIGLLARLGRFIPIILGEIFGIVLGGVIDGGQKLGDAAKHLIGPAFSGILSVLYDISKQFGTFILDLDETRRAMIPYIGTVEKTNEVHKGLAIEAARTRIPLSDLHSQVDEASEGFSMLNLEFEGSIVNLATLVAQAKQLGAAGVANIIESMVTDEGIVGIENATRAFKGLTMQMRDLGILPKEFSQDFQALIPTLALFGSAASTEIAKVSLLGRKARVDAQAIVDIADKFTEYGTAGQTIQELNAIFGQPIFRDPAALVRARFEQGPAGLVNQLVKGIQGRVDVDALTETPAGRAQLFALSQTLNKTVQETVRILRRGVLSDEEVERIQSRQFDDPAAAEFDELSKSTVNLAQQIKTAVQDLTLTAVTGLGVDFPQMSDIADQFIRLGTEVARDPLSDMAKEMRAELDAELISEGLPTDPTELLKVLKAARGDAASIEGIKEGMIGVGTQMAQEFLAALGLGSFGGMDEETTALMEQASRGEFGASYSRMRNEIVVPIGDDVFRFPIDTAFEEMDAFVPAFTFDENVLEEFIEAIKEMKQEGETLPPEITLRLADNLAVKAFVEKTAVSRINKGTDPNRKQLPQNDTMRRTPIGSRIGFPGT
jgi:hypothetical protein